MKISIATGPWLPVPPIEGGAVPRLWQGLAESFATRGHDVTIVARSHREQPQSETFNGVRYVRYGGFSQGRHVVFDLMKDFVYALATARQLPRADILVINDFWLPAIASTFRLNAGKIIVVVGRVPKGQLFLYKYAARLAAVSNAIKEAIIAERSSLAYKVKVFPNPTDINVFRPAIPSNSSKAGKALLYVGRVHPEKGVHILIEAFRLLAREFRTLSLRIVGPIEEHQGGGGLSYYRQLRAAAKHMNVEFLGPIFEPARLAVEYQGADLFCYPSLADNGESFGVAPLEAMATGLVPVVSDLKCFREFIDEGRTGYYFDHRDVDSVGKLAQVLREALLNPRKTSQMSSNARQTAKDFSYDHIAALYLNDFEELVSETTPNRADQLTSPLS